jgi:peptide/nickel transport system permease protein
MLSLALRRLGFSIVTLWAVSVLIFIGTEILPGDAAEARLGQEATKETLAALREKLGLDRPAPVRYVEWLGNVLRLDLGASLSGSAKIEDLIAIRLKNTLRLTIVTAAISIPLSLALGLLAAMFPGGVFDRIVTAVTLSVYAIPEFLVGTLLVFVFSVQLRWLPAIANVAEFQSFGHAFRSLAMPIAVLTFAVTAPMTRMTRAAVLNVLATPYIEMAILKGVPRRRIVMRHALFNAVGPIVNAVSLNLAYLVGGVIVVETIFAYPGLAKLMVDAVQLRDMPLVQACAMVFCLTYVVLILIADLASVIFNPRLQHRR